MRTQTKPSMVAVHKKSPRATKHSTDNRNSPSTIIERTENEESAFSSELPDPVTTDVHPDEYLAQIVDCLHGYRPVIKNCLSLQGDDFPEITERQLVAYDLKVVSAARDNDLDQLKIFHEQDKDSMSGCNRFGESILHLACRRGFEDMVDFLLNDETGPKLAVRVRDDCGRTPFHDACWNPHVQTKICSLLIERDPTLLLLADKRGHSPFQYARQPHWPQWRQFLHEHFIHLQRAMGEERNREIFSSNDQ